VRGVGTDPLRLHRLQKLVQQQRIAARRLVTGRHERLQLRLVHPHRRRHRHAETLEPSLEVGDESQRRAVAPMQIVDREQERPVRGDVRRQPGQPVQHRKSGIALRVVDRGRLEHPRGRRRGPREPPGAGLRIDQGRLEQLPDHPERQPALQIAAARREQSKAGCPRSVASRGQQPALTDSGRPLHQRQRRITLEHPLHQLVELGKLALALALEQAAPSPSPVPARHRHHHPWRRSRMQRVGPQAAEDPGGRLPISGVHVWGPPRCATRPEGGCSPSFSETVDGRAGDPDLRR
jgi:hypothetical protein